MYLLNTYLNTGVQRAAGDCICKKGGTLQTLLLSIPDEPAERPCAIIYYFSFINCAENQITSSLETLGDYNP